MASQGNAENINKCAACLGEINHRRFLVCMKCSGKFDLPCVNVPEKRFYNTMTAEHKKNWICPECKSKQPKYDNTNTPVRNQMPALDDENKPQTSNENITFRKRTTRNIDLSESIAIDDSPPQGDTLMFDTTSCQPEESLLLTEIREIKKQLTIQNQNQESFKNDLSDTIKTVLEGINTINNKQKLLETEIQDLRSTVQDNSHRISELEKENNKLRQDLQRRALSQDSANHSILPGSPSTTTMQQQKPASAVDHKNEIKNAPVKCVDAGERCKFLVLYGLNEYHHESDIELYDRVLAVFRDITHTNLMGYIEEMDRIGKKGYRRPLKIELLSKRMVKYLLSCRNMFKNSGLWISEYLDEQGLRERQQRRLNFRNSHEKSQINTQSRTSRARSTLPTLSPTQGQPKEEQRRANNHSFRP
ncbi:uncharacterized protein LOC114358724 [Ostrinia furnacalis]|uniref:uncharacterized protein LOC114358724 n=1 Tax=Ostrinia furnacalis TaxID=93504 RepID=UPI0010388755|nr:uncharacterized protein LOC114358724 [Ostrinia furnacalis]